jgi:hypothetical protein
MWCSTCQQDTPGVASTTSGRVVCSRCQLPVQKESSPYTSRICDDGLALDEPAVAQANASAAAASPFRTDDWAARQRVRTAARELRRPNPTTANTPNRLASDRQRFDLPQDLFGQIENATTPTIATLAPQTFAIDPSQKQSSGSVSPRSQVASASSRGRYRRPKCCSGTTPSAWQWPAKAR